MTRLFFLLARRVPPQPSPLLDEVYRLLRERGFAVDAAIPEDLLLRPEELAPAHDLYVLKSHTELALSLAGVLDAAGARFLNPYASCLATQDKIVAARRLAAAGVPTPRSWVTADLAQLRPVADSCSLILKPYRGHRGAGIRIVRRPDELDQLDRLDDGAAPAAPVLIQEYVPGSGEDLKVYVVGEDVFAVRKPFSPTSFTQPGRPCPVSGEVREIALRCGVACGLGLYGLDVIEGPDGPVVVDLNYFPGYKGVPNVAPQIADYIAQYAAGRVRLAPPALHVAPAARHGAPGSMVLQ